MSYIGNNLTIQQYAPQIAYFSGNGSTTTFTLPVPVVSAAQILVFVANVPQNPSSAFSVSGSTLTFTSAPASGTNNIWVEYTSLQTNTIAPSNGTVGQSQMNNPTGTGNPVLQTIPTLINPQITSNIQILTADAGVIFNKTSALNNQVLNDYEYGNFNPTFVATGCTFSYAYQSGYYVKVGKMVTCMIDVSLNGTGNSVNGNTLYIGNLPFAGQGGALYWLSANSGFFSSLASNVITLSGVLGNDSSTQIHMYKITAAATGMASMVASDLSTTAGSFISISITYPTTS